jgi:FtsH-binding integral membrane protein
MYNTNLDNVLNGQVKSQSSFISSVYLWMTLALTLTGFTAFGVASTSALVEVVIGNKLVFFGLMLAQLGLVFYISSAIDRLSSTTAFALFILYAILNGLTLSSIFLIYSAGSIATTFFITAGTFALMSAYGYFTDRDLTTIGNLSMMALVGLLLATLVNFFLQSSTLSWIISYVGVLIFTGLIAYDTQKIKEMSLTYQDGEVRKKGMMMGAFTLYLDFVNLFLYILRILGNRD